MIIAVIIWLAVDLIFWGIAISTWRSKKEAGFFTGVKPSKMKDVKAYNHAVAKIWFVFATIFGLLAIPLYFMEQNSPIAILIAPVVMFIIIGMIVAYVIVEKKYKA